MTNEDWFDQTPAGKAPEDPDGLAEKPPPSEILAKRSGELRSRRMKTAVDSPESAVYRCGLGIFLTDPPPTDAPKHLFRRLFPASGPVIRSSNGLHFKSKFLAFIVVLVFFLESGYQARGQTPNPAFPVGNITAQPVEAQTGAIAKLTWSIRLPDGQNSANYIHFIRQVRYPSIVPVDTLVDSSGEMLIMSLGMAGTRFELWSVCNSPLMESFLDTTVVSSYLPITTVTIRSEDTYPYLPRTRADRPFQVDINIQGMTSDPGAPDSLKSVTLKRHVQSYGASGVGNDIDRTQATLLSQSAITTNGAFTLSFPVHSIPGADSTKVRGEERFSVLTVGGLEMPSSIIDSKFIQIWPVASAVINGLTEGQTIIPFFPEITINLNDLYPTSTTYVQVYKGSPRADARGRIVPNTTFVVNSSTPQAHTVTIQEYMDLFDSDGTWTLEILTQTPFGTDRVLARTFIVQGVAIIRDEWREGYFGSKDNSGDGADSNDFDRDGLSNLIEFAFGLNPCLADRDLMTGPQTVGNQLVIDFIQPSKVGGIIYGAEWSSTLQPGSWILLESTAVPPRHTFSLDRNACPSGFMRLKVVGQ